MSLVSELEQISSNAKSSSSSEISNIWWDIKQNTHQVRPYLKGKRNLKLKDKQAADIALSEIHSSWFIWKTIRSTHSFNKVWLLVNHHESSSSKILLATGCRKVLNFHFQVITCTQMHACIQIELTSLAHLLSAWIKHTVTVRDPKIWKN